MAKNSIITSQGNVQFINSKGRTINIHPMHCYAVYEKDTVSFLFIYMKDYSGQAFFTSQYDDVEVNGESYDNINDLKDAINYAFAKAGAQARTEIVDELPEDPFTNTIYLLPKEHGEGYDEYIWNEDEGWQLIGDTDIEFDRYLQITVFNEYSADTKQYIDNVSGNTVTNHNDIVALSGAIDTEISARTDADAALSGAIDTVSSALTDETSARTAADTTLQNNINTANGRIDAEQLARASADTAISGAVDTLSGTVLSALTEDERVWGEALNDLNSRINTVSGDVITLGDNVQTLSGKVDTISGSAITSGDVQTQIDNSISGKVDTTDFNTYSGAVETRLAEDEEVTASGLNALNDKFGGLKLMKITQVAYDALTVKDNNTLYIISD